MKHVIGIIAHRAEQQLKWLVDDLMDQGINVLIHADRKNRQAILDNLQEHAPLVIEQSLDVKRGHISLVHAALALMSKAVDQPMDYFHLISGDDLMIKDRKVLDAACSSGLNFLQHVPLPIPQEMVDDPSRKDRIPLANYRHFGLSDGAELVQRRNDSAWWTHWLERRLGTFRTFWRLYNNALRQETPDLQFHCGSAWFSINQQLARYMVDYSDSHPALLEFFGRTRFPDEIYFQTLALNSPLRHRILNSDLRYIDWSRPVNEGPSILDIDEFLSSRSHPGIFARKWRFTNKEDMDTIIAQRNAR